ncbi:MAG: hypothetical protein KGJ78_11235 [Alphaproteobacteria bacterium]|nr:hypothetical protein [Alphaproteobacteria bacterium]
MTVNEELLMAYVDGELSVEEMRRIEAELAARPDLRAYVEKQQALTRSLHASFDEVLAAPIPKVLSEALAPRRRLFENLSWRRTFLWSGLPAAAALACGILIGVAVHQGPDIVSTDGGLVARGQLGAALNSRLASAGGGEIGISFRNKAGQYCRTFTTSGGSPLAGLACHEDGTWRIAAIGNAPKETGEYRQAASGMPEFLRSAVGAMIAGEPLDAQAERKARDSAWTAR